MEKRPIHVQGHRGACAELLENTLPSFQRAFELGADSIELDIHVTKDKQIAVYHDFCLNRFCCRGPKGKQIVKPTPLYSLTLADLKACDCLDEHRLRAPNELTEDQRKIPSLLEVFELFSRLGSRPKPFVIDIELKSDPNQPQLSAPPPVFVKLVLDAIEKHWNKEHVVLRSFDARILKEIKRQAPRMRMAALTPDNFHRYEWVLNEFKPDLIAPDLTSIHASDIRLIHQRGAEVIPYTVNEPRDWKRLIEMGVDGMTTDDPGGLLKYLAEST